MLFNSLSFLIFFPIVVGFYFIIPKNVRWVWLLIASYYYYMSWSAKYAALLALSTVITWLSGLLIDRCGGHPKGESLKKWLIAFSFVSNLAILFIFKYFHFGLSALNKVLHLLHISPIRSSFSVLLPVGISFYILQALSYTMDVYRGKVKVEKNLLKYALFVSFFPQLVAGPIERSQDLLPQILVPHEFDFERVKHGLWLMLWGFFQKLVIADRAVIVIGAVTSAYADYDGSAILMAAVLYALQIYADFSGGIDISRGIAQILGIELAENFRRPYFSRSISEYWRRWHISLGAWMRNYVFYSLTTSKAFLRMGRSIRSAKPEPSPARLHTAKVFPTALASLIVFLLVGIWHGANLKYVGFGLWNGGIIMLSVLLAPEYEKLRSALRIRAESRLFILFQMVRTFFIVLVGYYFDIAPSFAGAVDMMRRSVTDLHFKAGTEQILSCGVSPKQMGALAFGAAVMLAVSAAQERRPEESLRLRLEKRPALSWLLLFLCIACTMVFGVYGPGYDSGAFVYMQF